MYKLVHDYFSIQVTEISKQGATREQYVLTEEVYDTPPATFDVKLEELVKVVYSF